jgi:hypothetical protein
MSIWPVFIMTNKEYENAMKCYKNVLKYAWIMQRNDLEMLAYEKLSIQYFLIGRIDKSKDYHERYNYGYLEPKESSIQVLTNLKYQNQKKEIVNIDIKDLKYEDAIDSSSGFLSKLKEILSSDEDRELYLGLYCLNESFKIQTPTSIPETKVTFSF